MVISKVRTSLLAGGIVYVYAAFIAGYFLLPMAAGHRRLYYILVVPAVLLLWRELYVFYRSNTLAGLVVLYAGYMMSTLAWTADFDAAEAILALWYGFALLTFVLLSGFIWDRYPLQVAILKERALWLAAAAALVSILVWYLDHPFPASRLEPLGVMHHPNKSACAYGLFVLLAIHALLDEHRNSVRAVYVGVCIALLSLILLTQSRAALAGVFAGLLALAGYRALGVIAVTFIASWVLLASNDAFWQDRVLNFSFRPGIWHQVLETARATPWFGQGYLVDTAVPAYGQVFDHAHNSYLASLRDGGAVGLVLLLLMLAVAAHRGWQLRKHRGEKLYLALLLSGVTCIAMDFDRLLVHPKEIWLFFWLPVALIMGAPDPAGAGRSPPGSLAR